MSKHIFIYSVLLLACFVLLYAAIGAPVSFWRSIAVTIVIVLFQELARWR